MTNISSITALVPAYQSAEFIERTLDSLAQQTYDNFNVIISVDLCDDNTFEVCSQYCLKDARFSVFQQNERLKYVGNCNFLLDHTDADYVLFAFHDDILDSSYIEKLSLILDNNSEMIMAFSDVSLTTLEGESEYWEYTELENIKDRVKRGLTMLSRKALWSVPNRGIFRLDRARKIQGLKTHAAGEFSTDWPWLFHMSLLGQFQRVPEILCYKFFQKGSLSRSWAFSQEQWYEVTLACLREIKISPLSILEKTHLASYVLLLLVRIRLNVWRKVLASLIKSSRKALAPIIGRKALASYIKKYIIK